MAGQTRKDVETDGVQQTVTALVEILQSDRSAEDAFVEAGAIMREVVPWDRLTLGLLKWGWLYRLEEGRVQRMEATRFDGTGEEGKYPYASQWVMAYGQPLLRRDIAKERQFSHDERRIEEGMLSDLILPLVLGGEIVGTFNFTSRQAGTYDEGHLKTAQALSSVMGLVVKYFQDRQETAAIQKISDAIRISLDLDEIMEKILEHICGQGYERVRVYLYDEGRESMVGQAEMGLQTREEFRQLVFPVATDPYTEKTMDSDGPCIYQTDTPEYDELLSENRPIPTDQIHARSRREWCEIPLKVQEANRSVIVGKISLDNARTGHALMQDRLDRLMVYASQAAVAIRHAQLYSEMSELVEARAEQTQYRDALLRINKAVQQMTDPEDIAFVMRATLEEVKALGIKADTMAIHRVLDPEKSDLEVCRMGGEGAISVLERRISRSVIKIWRTGLVNYRSDTEEEGGHEEGLARLRKRFGGLQIRSLVNVPVAQGVISAHSVLPKAFSQADIQCLREIADVLLMGMTRAEDMAKTAASEQLLAEAQRIAHLGSWEWDINTDTSVFSDEMYLLLGLQPQEGSISYERFLECIHPDDRETVSQEIGQSLSTGQNYDCEFRVVHAADAVWILHSRAKVILDETGQPARMVVMCQDVTERRQMEEELVRRQRLSATGELAAGVSHNLNNILSGVLIPAQLLEREVEEPGIRDRLDTIIHSARMASDLLSRLNASVRNQAQSLVAVEVTQVVHRAVEITRPRWKDESESKGITVEMTADLVDVPLVQARATGMVEILTALLFNAVDALPEGGRIRIGSRVVEGEVEITVNDTGVGMDEETRLRVFEPFFTTKVDVGTGLGLSTAHGIATRWGGHDRRGEHARRRHYLRASTAHLASVRGGGRRKRGRSASGSAELEDSRRGRPGDYAQCSV